MSSFINAISAALTSWIVSRLKRKKALPKIRVLPPDETFDQTLPPDAIPGNDDSRQWKSLLDKLRTIGFFDAVSSDNVDAVVARCLESKWIFDDDVKRQFFADCEHLAEQGIKNWLENDVAPNVARWGVKIPTVREVCDDDQYTVSVGDRTYSVRTQGDSESDFWANAAKTGLRIVNHLLEDARIPDRLYWIHGGEDGVVAFLTPEQFKEVTLALLVNSNSWPYGRT